MNQNIYKRRRLATISQNKKVKEKKIVKVSNENSTSKKRTEKPVKGNKVYKIIISVINNIKWKLSSKKRCAVQGAKNKEKSVEGKTKKEGGRETGII